MLSQTDNWIDQPVIVQDRLPVKPWAEPRTARLPGINPLDWADWLLVDEAYAAQMALRERLLSDARDKVLVEAAPEAAGELLALVITHLDRRTYRLEANSITRPDGEAVPLDRWGPLETAARLVQQDLCIMERGSHEHLLTAAALCFPANWRLSDKVGRPMTTIHGPVESFDDQMAARVQRMFDAMRADRPLWRANYLLYADHALHQPERLRPVTRETGKWVRVERQSLVKLPRSNAIVFGIHTVVVPVDVLSDDDRRAFLQAHEARHP